MKPGDIVLIRFPQANLQAGKLRPALIISTVPGRHSDLLLAMISSRIHQAIPNFDEMIETTEADYTTTGLKARSVIRVARLVTVEASVINARLGAVSDSRLQRVKSRLVKWLEK